MVVKIKWDELDIIWLGDPERAYSKKDRKLLNGHYEYYYDNGSLRSRGTWIDGMKEGVWRHYHKDGSIWGRGFHHKDKRFPSSSAWEINEKGSIEK